MQSKFSNINQKKPQGGWGAEEGRLVLWPLSAFVLPNNTHFVNYTYGVPVSIDPQGVVPLCTWNRLPKKH